MTREVFIISWFHSKKEYADDEYQSYYYDHPKWRKFKRILWRIIWIPTVSVILVGGITVGVLYWRYQPILNKTPQFSVTKLNSPLLPHRVIKASDGTILWQNSSILKSFVTPQQLQPNLTIKKALLSIEDRDFYRESGVNYPGIIRASVFDIFHHNQNMQGGSTLTQQLIKLSYFSTNANERTINRKLQEIQLARQANAQLSKNQILALYMNKVYLGQGVYGMASAAKYYMNRPLDKLSLSQAALLAGMVQSPSAYDPYIHPKLAQLRRNIVLKAMLQNHQINKQAYHHALSVPVSKSLVPLSSHMKLNQTIETRTLLASDFIQRAKTQMINAPTNNQTVVTSLNWPLQKWLALAIKHNDGMQLPNKQLQVGITVMNNRTGQVIAQVGNRTFNHLDGYNRAVQTNRSAGSVVKPVLDYGPAMDQLHWGSNHILTDEKMDYPHTNIQVHDWDDQYLGDMTVKKALYLSRNVPALKAFLAIGASTAHQYAKQFGITTKLTPSSAIGLNVSSEQMASAFSALAQQGVMVKPRYINQTIINNRKINAQSIRGSLFSKQAAFMLTKSLENVPTNGQSGYAAQINNFHQAGKTGTIAYSSNLHMPANAVSDAWYVGYNQDYTISVWTGYDNPNQRKYILKNDDNKISEIIYKRIMLKLRSEGLAHNKAWSEPSGIQQMMDNSYGWTHRHGTFVTSKLVQ